MALAIAVITPIPWPSERGAARFPREKGTMSDDTPTRPHGARPGDIPAERPGQPDGPPNQRDKTAAPDRYDLEVDSLGAKRKSTGLLVTLLALGVAVLIAVIAIMLLLLGRDQPLPAIPSNSSGALAIIVLPS